ncbi:heavy-metal-associated domain-containing protein [Spirosoma knui]
MKTLMFKTTLTDADSVAAVTPFLNAIEPLDGFSVETEHADHLLTVQTVDNRVSEEVIRAVERAGYQAEVLKDH